jgi:hypothetical protein
MAQFETVSKDDVSRVCIELGLPDWSRMARPEVTADAAKAIQDVIGGEASHISLAAFQNGIQVELEHGTRFPDANLTNNHPVLTGKIVLAHLKESLEYYERLQVAELEGDLFKAIRARDADKTASVMTELARAKRHVADIELAELSQL